MANKRYQFQKEERLCSKKLIDQLFNNGSSFLVYPFRLTWLSSPDADQKYPAKVLIGVPKKRFKHSVDRNLIKRRIKEAYRLNKEDHFYRFLREKNIQLNIAINYVGKEIHEFEFLEKKILKVFSENLKHIGI